MLHADAKVPGVDRAIGQRDPAGMKVPVNVPIEISQAVWMDGDMTKDKVAQLPIGSD